VKAAPCSTPGEHNRPIEPAPPSDPITPPPSSARRLFEHLAGWVLPEENPTGAVYGVILIGALLAAESGRHETYADTLVSAVLAACLYWVAHSYASVLGRRLAGEERLTVTALSRALGHDWALVRGAMVPLLALALAWAAGATQENAVTAALWSAIVSLVAFELLAGLRSHSSARELTIEMAVGMAMGLGILALKVILH
jgi:hypothetical protein